MFRQFGIFSQVGQLYRPQDADQLMFYKEDKTGQMLQEGINEAGAMSSWIAAATSYSTSNVPMIPFYIYYSMFGFQRVGDLAWAAGDMRARGFLIGGTSGRTTLNGEGLQHEDGHSHLISATIPNCVSYDPTYAYEVAVIVHDGLRRMLAEQEDVFYYLTTLNENYEHPAMPEGAEEGIVKGMYLLKPAEKAKGTSAADGIGGHPARSDRWRRAAGERFRHHRRRLERDELHRAAPRSACRRALEHAAPGGAVARPLRHAPPLRARRRAGHRLDRLHEALCRPDPPLRSRPLSRARHRRLRPLRLPAQAAPHFEVDRHYVAVAALKSLAEENKIPSSKASEAIKMYGIDPDKPDPVRV